MMKKGKSLMGVFTIFLFLTLCQIVFGQDIRIESVLFNTDKWQLTIHQKEFINQIIDSIANNQYQVEVNGYTDNVGDSLYNIHLSQKRANAVYEYLVSLNLQKDKITLGYYGESNPVKNNESILGRQANRRVEIIIKVFPELKKTPEIKPEVNLNPLRELYEQLSMSPTTFCYNFQKDTVIIGEQGTILYIRANSFNIDPDTLSECIKISFKERFKKSEIVFDNLSTISNGELLISQAMLFIDATYKGNQVELIKDITVFSPADTILSDMILFEGQRDIQGNMNWIAANQPVTSINGSDFSDCESINSLPPNFERCRFFFCKINNFFKKIFTKKERRENKDSPMDISQVPTQENDPCEVRQEKLNAFQEKYGNLSIDKLKNIPKEELQYYVFNRRLGWTNLDWMVKINDRVKLKVLIKPEQNLDIKIVFKSQRTIVPLLKENGYYYFNGLPRGYNVWVVALKFENNMPTLALEEKTLNGADIKTLNFESYSIPDLRRKLKVLD